MEQQEMIEYTTQDIIAFLMEDAGIPLEQAMDRFYASRTFEALSEPKTGLYLQGSAYVYEYFKEEQMLALQH